MRRRFEGGRHLVGLVHHLQATTATAVDRLDCDGQAVFACELDHFGGVLNRLRGTGCHRRAHFGGDPARRDFRAEHADRLRLRPHPHHSRVDHGLSEVGGLGEESVPRRSRPERSRRSRRGIRTPDARRRRVRARRRSPSRRCSGRCRRSRPHPMRTLRRPDAQRRRVRARRRSPSRRCSGRCRRSRPHPMRTLRRPDAHTARRHPAPRSRLSQCVRLRGLDVRDHRREARLGRVEVSFSPYTTLTPASPTVLATTSRSDVPYSSLNTAMARFFTPSCTMICPSTTPCTVSGGIVRKK